MAWQGDVASTMSGFERHVRRGTRSGSVYSTSPGSVVES
jgi:hypothetical protein